MQIPTEWIKEFCGLDTTDDQMANQLTMAGVECELLSTSNQEILDLSLTLIRTREMGLRSKFLVTTII